MANAKRDENSVPTLLGVSSADGITPVVLWADPTTHRLLTDSATGMSNPMTTGGDLIYGGVAGAPTRLANGNAGEVLTSQGTTLAPIWTPAGAGDMVLAATQTVTGAKTFNENTLLLDGSTSGATTLNAPAVAGSAVITLPSVTTVLPGLSLANSYTTAQTITPLTDVIALTARRNNGTQTANILEIQTEANAFLAGFDKVGKLTVPALLVSGLTASEMVITDGSSNVVSAPVATYPSLTELSYVKGLTSALQTQLNGKQASLGYTAENVANKSTTTSLGTSDTLYPTQNAVKVYADTKALLAGSTSQAFSVSQLEVGNASDTTITRSAAGQIAVEGVVIPSVSSTNTITNKRNQSRTASSTTSSNLSPDLSTANIYFRTTQTATLTIDAPTGTPVIGEVITLYVDSAGAQTLTINATYKAFGAAFPAATTAGKTFMMTAMYNGTDWKTTWANAV